MRTASLSPTPSARGPLGSRRLLALAADERLVDQIRRGNETAFEVVFERHAPAILGFCRHMLGSPHEAEDAVQQTFASAHRALQRHREREIALKPWLFAIARNRCLSLLRARHEEPLEAVEPHTAGLSEQVEQRAELRGLLADLRELPEEQRAALLLTELGDLSHAEVAHALGCQVARVKALVFRARSGLIQRRAARETPCEQIQEQLATARRGGLRRTELRLHLRECPDCRAYRAQVKQQRQMLAVALPVAPTVGLKSSVLAAVGIGGGAAGIGGGAAGGGALGAGLAKVALVGALVGGGAAAGDAVLEPTREARPSPEPAAGAPVSLSPEAVAPARGSERSGPETAPVGRAGRPSRGARPAKRSGHRSKARAGGRAGTVTPGQAVQRNAARGNSNRGRGRGPVEAPPAATPVRRGPPAAPPGAARGSGRPPGKPAQKVKPLAGPVKAPPARSKPAAPSKPAAQPKPSRTARP